MLAVFFLFGWFTGRHNGRNSVGTAEIGPISGVVTAEDTAKGMSETPPDTIYVPKYIHIEKDGHDCQMLVTHDSQTITPEVVPIETVEGPKRDSVINAALID